MTKFKKTKKINKNYLFLLIFILGSNFVLFQNFIGNPNVNDASGAPFSARAFTERVLIELNQVRPESPEANAMMVALTFGISVSAAVYSGRYDAAAFAAAGVDAALSKYDRYQVVQNIAKLSDQDAKLVQTLKNSIAPFLTSLTMPNQPFNYPLDENTQLQVTSGQMSFVTKDAKGNTVFTKNYDFTTINNLLREMNDRAQKRPIIDDKKVITFPKLFADMDDDPSDRTDSIRQTTDTIMSELAKDHQITIADMFDHNLIRDPFNPTIADVAPLAFDENFNPIISKITYEYKSSFDPSAYTAPPASSSTVVSGTDPYDSTYYDYYSGDIVTTPPADDSGSGGSGGGSGGGGTDYISHPDPNYDSYDNQGTPFTTPNPSTGSGTGGSTDKGTNIITQ